MIGGDIDGDESSTELYDPSFGSWITTGVVPPLGLGTPWTGWRAASIDERVLLFGMYTL